MLGLETGVWPLVLLRDVQAIQVVHEAHVVQLLFDLGDLPLLLEKLELQGLAMGQLINALVNQVSLDQVNRLQHRLY